MAFAGDKMDAAAKKLNTLFLFLYITLLSSPLSILFLAFPILLLAFPILHSLASNTCLRWLLRPPPSFHFLKSPASLLCLAVFHLRYIGELGVDFEVFRNDELTVEEIRRKNPKGILISPGPGAPQDSGISLQTVVELGPSIPLFGVCMGLQCIGEAFGGKIVRSPSGVRHGKSSLVYYDEKLGEILFDGLSNPFSACRYHSLIIEKETFPSDKLEITAWTEDGLIMAARHKKYKHIKGVQFHPESIITPDGKMMILNFIKFLDKFHL